MGPDVTFPLFQRPASPARGTRWRAELNERGMCEGGTARCASAEVEAEGGDK